MPIERATVYQIRERDLVLQVPDLMGLYTADFATFEDGWRVDPAPVNDLTSEQWLKPGTWVEDSTDRARFFISGINDKVHLRADNSNLGSRSYSREEALRILIPQPISVPFWATVGCRVRAKNTGQVYTIREIDVFTRRVSVGNPDINYATVFSATDFEQHWELHTDRESANPPKFIKPNWLRGGIFIRSLSTAESFWVASVHEASGDCVIDEAKWCIEGPEQRRVPTIGKVRKRVQFEQLTNYELLDTQGFPTLEKRCPTCGEFGSLRNHTSLQRAYHCPRRHEWSFSYNGLEEGSFMRTRYDIDLDV